MSGLKRIIPDVDVALRKESVDRNRRGELAFITFQVALRKESVDRNITALAVLSMYSWSLSARRAWIEIRASTMTTTICTGRSPQGERG